jgi:hypothetical protein
LISALGLALLPATSGAQQKSLKDQLVGTRIFWDLRGQRGGQVVHDADRRRDIPELDGNRTKAGNLDRRR